MKTISAIRAESPFPWSHQVHPNTGQIIVLDARGNQVPLFSVVELVILVTRAAPSST